MRYFDLKSSHYGKEVALIAFDRVSILWIYCELKLNNRGGEGRTKFCDFKTINF